MSTSLAAGQAGLGILGYANRELVTQASLEAGSTIGSWTLPADAKVLEPTGDFNGDGHQDLIIWTSAGLALVSANSSSKASQPGGWQLLTAINNGTKAGGWQVGTDRQIVHGVGDFNGDGRDDLLLTGPNAIGVLTLGRKGLTTLAMHTNGTRLGGWIIDTKVNRIEGIGDFDGNDRADVLITSGWGIGVLTLSGKSLTSVMLKPNGTRFGGWLYSSAGNPIQGIGDFDGNGRDDFVLTSGWGIGILTLSGTTFNSLMLKPNGTRFGGWLYDSRGNPIAEIGDFDGNGRDDILLTSGWGIGVLTLSGTTFNSLMLKPNGTRFGGWLYDSKVNATQGIGDFDGNGRDDIIITSGWGVGLLTLDRDTFDALAMKPNGTRLGPWTLAKDDRVATAARLTNQVAAAFVLQRPPGSLAAPAEAVVKPLIAFNELQRSPASGTVAVLSADLASTQLSVPPSSNDVQIFQTLNSKRIGSQVIVGRLRQVGPEGMTVNNPLLYDDQGVSSIGTDPLRFGDAARFSNLEPGTYRLAPGTRYLSDVHFGSGGFGPSCPACPGRNSLQGCGVLPDSPGGLPGGGGVGPDPSPQPGEFNSLLLNEATLAQSVTIDGASSVCGQGCPPSPAECQETFIPPPKEELPFGAIACESSPPSKMSKVCQQQFGLYPEVCDGRGPVSYESGSASLRGMLGDPKCMLADYAPDEIPPECNQLLNQEQQMANLAGDAPELAPQFQYIACLITPGLGVCEAARQSAVSICPTGSPQSCTVVPDVSQQTYKFCSQNSCLICGPATNYTCVPTGPDPSIQFSAAAAFAGDSAVPPDDGDAGKTEDDNAGKQSDADNKKNETPAPNPNDGDDGSGGDGNDGSGDDDPFENYTFDDSEGSWEWSGGDEDSDGDDANDDAGADNADDDAGADDGDDDAGADDDDDADGSNRVPATDDPISLTSGELSIVKSDASYPSRGVNFDFARRYGSSGLRSGALGPGWIHAFEDYIEVVGDRFNRRQAPEYCAAELPKVRCLYLYDEYGGQTLYVVDRRTGVFAPQPGGFGLIRATEKGYKLLTPGGITRTYNLVGRLESIYDAEGFGLTLSWRIRDWAEVDRDGNPFRYGFGGPLDQFLESFGIAFDGAGQTGLNFRQRRGLFARLELDRVVDSYGRVFELQYQSFPGTDTNVVRRRRLTAIRHRGENIVEYQYTWLPVTQEAYLTTVRRLGLTAGLDRVPPVVTHYEYQHDIIKDGGLLGPVPPGGGLPDRRTFRGRVLEVIYRLQRDINVCTQIVTGIGLEPTPTGNPCEEKIPEQFASRIQRFNVFNLLAHIQLDIADNIVRVYQSERETVPVLETYFEPDPTSIDFDRAIHQRYGNHPAVNPLPREEKAATGETLYTWSSTWPQVSFRQSVSGEPDSLPLKVRSVSRQLNDAAARNFLAGEIDQQIIAQEINAATQRSSNSGTLIDNPDRHAAWYRDDVQVPDVVLNAVPLIESVAQVMPDYETEEAETCDHFDSLVELPRFFPRAPAGKREDRSIGNAPRVVRTRESCSEIAGRQSRDPFKNEAATYCGRPGLPECSAVAIPGQRRNALEWDVARVCRWVQVENRDGRVDWYGLNFYGQTLVMGLPAPDNDNAWRITIQEFNADGLRTLVRHADGSQLRTPYAGQAPGLSNVLQRANVAERTEIAGSTPDLQSVTPNQRTWKFSYEPAFQQLARIDLPDGNKVEFFYDYQQLDGRVTNPDTGSLYQNSLTQLFAMRLGQHRIQLPNLGQGLFLGRDLDGDGEFGRESTSGLVAVRQTKVALGGGILGDVGVRYRRDASGRLIVRSNIRDVDAPDQDFDYTEFYYYPDLTAAEAGNTEGLSPPGFAKPGGPLALTRVRRSLEPPQLEDTDLFLLAYDPLGGIRRTRENNDPETDVNVRRNAHGRVTRVTNTLNYRVDHQYDAVGRLIRTTRSDEGRQSPPQISAWAWSAYGDVIGNCNEIVAGSCDRFQSFADRAVVDLGAGRAPPGTADFRYGVTRFDASDRPLAMADSTGGLTSLTRNRAGLVLRETRNTKPLTVTEFVYDRMGRPVRLTKGPGSQNPLVKRYRWDGFGRLAATQVNGPADNSAFDADRGTVFLNRYDSLDHVIRNSTIGDDGTGARKVLRDVSRQFNEAGDPLFVHRLAGPLPDALPTVPTTISTRDGWASQELRYDHALRLTFDGLEGVQVPTTYAYDGFGLRHIATPTSTTEILINPRARTTTRQFTLLGDNGAGNLSWQQVLVGDASGRIVKKERFDGTLSSNAPTMRTSFVYDGLGQTMRVANEDRRQLEMVYDRAGRVAEKHELDISGERQRSTGYRYDSMGRLVRIDGPSGQTIETNYDAGGRELDTAIVGPASRIKTAYRYDDAGRMLAQSRGRADNSERVTEYHYADNRAVAAAVTVDRKTVREWTFDGLDRPIIGTDWNVIPGDSPLASNRPKVVMTVAYDALGRIRLEDTRATYPGSGGSNQVGVLAARYGADFLGPRQIDTSNESLLYSYSGRGNPITLRRQPFDPPPGAGMELTFSWQGELLASARVAGRDGADLVHARGRDGFGRLLGTRLTTSGGQLLRRDDVLLGPGGRITASRREGAFSGIAAKGYGYDGLGRLVEHTAGPAPTLSLLSDSRVTSLLDEKLGLELVAAQNSAAATFSLTDGLQSVSPDQWGRRYAAADKPELAGAPLVEVNGRPLQIDPDHRVAADGELTYVHDPLDRLVAVRLPGEEISFAYDALGRRRIEARTGSAATKVAIQYQGPNAIQTNNLVTGALLTAVTHLPGNVDAPFMTSFGPTDPAQGAIIYLLSADVRGDVVAAVDIQESKLVEESVFGPWGNRVVFKAANEPCVEGAEQNGFAAAVSDCAPKASLLSGWGIGGAVQISGTKLTDLRDRFYSPQLRAYLSPDPLGPIDSFGLWNYVAGDPVNWRDPFGLAKDDVGDKSAPSTPTISDIFDMGEALTNKGGFQAGFTKKAKGKAKSVAKQEAWKAIKPIIRIQLELFFMWVWDDYFNDKQKRENSPDDDWYSEKGLCKTPEACATRLLDDLEKAYDAGDLAKDCLTGSPSCLKAAIKSWMDNSKAAGGGQDGGDGDDGGGAQPYRYNPNPTPEEKQRIDADCAAVGLSANMCALGTGADTN